VIYFQTDYFFTIFENVKVRPSLFKKEKNKNRKKVVNPYFSLGLLRDLFIIMIFH